MTPELLANYHCGCGENPLYDEKRDVLYWCDIAPGKIFALDLKSGAHHLIYQGAECGAFVLQDDGNLLLLSGRDALTLNPQSGHAKPLKADVVRDTGRFNDCIVDPAGRVFAGTVGSNGKKNGGLFALGHDLNAQPVYIGTGCANGYAFTPEYHGVYWSDSTAKTIYHFNYDGETGALSNQRAWLETPDLIPDGLTINETGELWVAFFDGGFLRRYSSMAVLLEEVPLPAQHVTSCIFGGADFQQLFVTTAGGEEGSDTLDGALFRLIPEIGGKAEFRARIAF